jgi:phenylalanyl-tRNA synthetase alpha chain
MLEQIAEIKNLFNKSLQEIKTLPDLETEKIRFLGRKGLIATLFETLGDVPQDSRPVIGQQINALKKEIEIHFSELKNKLNLLTAGLQSVDITLPGRALPVGKRHPLHQVADQIKAIFSSMGFEIADGPEVETDYYNFEALNMPRTHPARDMQDTLYISDNLVLRTHTSPVQIRVMESRKPPIRIIAPGRVFRRDTPDASHSPFFHQSEGLVVGEDVTFADLKGVIESFAAQMLGREIKVRFRPSFFPFTEPSVEYDFNCVFCKGKGCRVCKNTGWLEISGAGMVHPNVLKNVGYDPGKISGYAFGMGIDRLAMLKFNINDIRILFENDLRFINQF